MKKIIYCFLILFLSCNDGDLTIETFNFGTAVPTTCNPDQPGFFIYKTNGNEVITLKINENAFLNAKKDAQTYSIPSEVQIVYRIYSNPISDNFLCTSPPPTSPVVTEEWEALSGFVTISSTTIGTDNTTNNSSRFSGLNHEINIIDLNFRKPDGSQQLFRNYNFGAYKNSFSSFPDTFGPDENFGICIINNELTKLSKTTGKQSLVLEAPSLFLNTNQDGTSNNPINNNNIKLNYYLFKENANAAGICANSTPTLLQNWIADVSSPPLNGIIRVLKEPILNSNNVIIKYKYTVTLINVTFTRNGFTFKAGATYNFGVFERNAS
jgi:hypothetical protein